jgi:UDP-N-acetylglucosamine acyltransferase
MAKIHPTAVIEKGAEIGTGVEIGPFCVIGGNVRVGQDSRIFDHVHISGRTEIGRNNVIYPHCTLGTPAQDVSDMEENNRLVMGDFNILRAYVHFNIGTSKGGGITRIGSHNYFMASSHVAHDCRVGNHVTLTNLVALGGHVIVEDFANISFGVAVHQFNRIGTLSMIGGGAMITRDVPPYALVVGSRFESSVYNINAVGMRRQGISREVRNAVKEAFRILFWQDLNTSQALEKIHKTLSSIAEVRHLVEFIKASERGIIKGKHSKD